MTIRQIADTAGCSIDTVKRLSKMMFPEVIAPRKGIALDFSQEQSISLMDRLPKKNYVEQPSANAPSNIMQMPQVNNFDMQLFANILSVSLSVALKPIYDRLDNVKPSLPAPQKDERSYFVQLVRNYADKKLNGDFGEAYNIVYKEILYRLKINVKTRAKNEGIKSIDYIDREGLLSVCISIVMELMG